RQLLRREWIEEGDDPTCVVQGCQSLFPRDSSVGNEVLVAVERERAFLAEPVGRFPQAARHLLRGRAGGDPGTGAAGPDVVLLAGLNGDEAEHPLARKPWAGRSLARLSSAALRAFLRA